MLDRITAANRGGRFHRGKHKGDNIAMHVDHLMFAAGPAGLDEDAARLGEILGTSFINGGVHPSFGTRNRILPLTGPRYICLLYTSPSPRD